MLYLFIWIWKEDTWISKTKYYDYVLSMAAAHIIALNKNRKRVENYGQTPF